MNTAPPANALTIDAILSNTLTKPTDYLQPLEAFLTLLQKHNTSATFFVPGCMTQTHAPLIKTIHQYGHEVGCFGHQYVPITSLSPNALYHDISMGKQRIEDLLGRPIHGYRAPYHSLTSQTNWAWDIIAKAGYRYSSSIHPGDWQKENGNLNCYKPIYPTGQAFMEVPISHAAFSEWASVLSNAAYMQFLPNFYLKKLFKKVNLQYQQAFILQCDLNSFLHSTQGDRIATSTIQKRTLRKLTGLLSYHHWSTLKHIFLDQHSTHESGDIKMQTEVL